MPDPIPVHAALSDVYSSAALLAQGERWDRLAKRFVEAYGEHPLYTARAPGRVNVVGVRSCPYCLS